MKSGDKWFVKWNETKGSDFNKALQLFSSYSNPGFLAGFFSNNLYREQVRTGLSSMLHQSGFERHVELFHSVEYVLARVKQELQKNEITPAKNDELTVILNVIDAMTGVKYDDIDAETVITEYNSRYQASAEETKKRDIARNKEFMKGYMAQQRNNTGEIEYPPEVSPSLYSK